GMLLARAGPEHAALRVDLLLGDARVVRNPALRGAAQLIEDRARRVELKELTPAHPRRQIAQDLPIAARLIFTTRPSRLVVVPSSSHQTAPGSTTSASSAVSDMKKSITTSGSRSARARCSTALSGNATIRLEQSMRQLLISPSAIRCTIWVAPAP